MTKQHYLRKLQMHGTGREIHVPPEICEKLGIDAGDDVDFVNGPGNNVALRNPSRADDGEGNEQANAAAIEQGRQQNNSPMDPEKTITLFYSKRGCIISGKLGCGKMSLAKKLCQDRRRIIVYDILGEYTEGVVFENFQKLKTFWAHVQHGNFRIIYRPLHPKREFKSICELVNESENLTFLIEHLDWYCGSLQLTRLIKNGCDHQIELIGTTENPQAIDKRLTSNTGQRCQLVSSPT